VSRPPRLALTYRFDGLLPHHLGRVTAAGLAVESLFGFQMRYVYYR
jgi:hypothetical protein